MFRTLVTRALLAGLVAGLVLTAVTLPWATPLILEAETYEVAQHAPHAPGHHHDHEWAPQDGLERNLYTAIADILLGIGYAFLLAAFMALADARGLRQGLAWGGAGFLVFFLLPALGLPPELPGTQSAELNARQAWWLLTVAASGAGLALLVRGPGWGAKLLGGGLLLLPHLVGAPHPPSHEAAVPESLLHRFWLAVTVANALFWLVLGAVLGWLSERGAKAPGDGLTSPRGNATLNPNTRGNDS